MVNDKMTDDGLITYDDLTDDERELLARMKPILDAQFQKFQEEWDMFEQLRDDLAHAGLTMKTYENPDAVGWRGWVEAPTGVVAFVGNDGALVWHW
jgi:hypothetical protein